MARIDFWYELASTYSYPAAARIEELAARAGVDVRWRPFLLGPIFQAQGWNTSPFNLWPAKGDYMWRDVARIGEPLGLTIRKPDPFPQNTLLAARIALALEEPARIAFSKAVYRAEFTDRLPIAEESVLATILTGIGLDPKPVLERARTDEVKAKLRTETAEAQSLGIFGAPSFVTETRELFWGNDRLEAALAAARRS